MPDKQGKTSGPGTTSPDQAYKEGRSEDVQEGSLGVDTGGAGVQKSRLPEGKEERGTSQSGGFAGQEADDSPDAGTVGSSSGEGDPSPHGTPEGDGGSGDPLRDVGEGAKDLAPGERGDDPDIGERGISQLSDGTDAADPESRQTHPKTPSDMGNR